MVRIKPIDYDHLWKILEERHRVMETLRTPYLLTDEMQEKWYEEIICDRNSRTRYFEFHDLSNWVGYGGIENIEWENSTAEISLLIFEDSRGHGYGKQCVDKILDQAFNYYNLKSVWGECYECNETGIKFWQSVCLDKNAVVTTIPMRKYYNGRYWPSMHFTFINKEK